MSVLIAVSFAVINGYGAYRSFKTRQWVWFAFTLLVTLWCAYDAVMFLIRWA